MLVASQGAIHLAVRCWALNPTNKWVPCACFQAFPGRSSRLETCTRAGRRGLPGIQCWFKRLSQRHLRRRPLPRM